LLMRSTLWSVMVLRPVESNQKLTTY
jgi:hypothetical protein